MTRVLLDVNVLIALMDPDHVAHERVHAWAARGLAGGWATCALTQNGFARVLSQPSYPSPVLPSAAIALLAEATQDPRHEFWPCDLELTQAPIVAARILGHRQITDTYLLGLAVSRGRARDSRLADRPRHRRRSDRRASRRGVRFAR